MREIHPKSGGRRFSDDARLPTTLMGGWPDVVATYAMERHRATGADANGFACAAMQAMSVAIHPLSRLAMQPGGDWGVPPPIWVGIFGDLRRQQVGGQRGPRARAAAREARAGPLRERYGRLSA